MTSPTEHPQEHSYWPLFVALGILFIAIGVVSTWFVSIFGLVLLISSIIGWVIENNETIQGEEAND
ncbi:MAG: cytochrome c oxidase subunit 4 [Anaerolineae bacterium]|nr:cytochrome c oxidase subunit 4 [Anaerolineae bacterium]